MNIIIIRSSRGIPDSRVEKIANSLIRDSHNVKLLAWDRSKNHDINESSYSLPDGLLTATHIGIKAAYGEGIKKMFFPLLLFQLKVFIWLIKNCNEYDFVHACDFDTVIPSYIFSKIYHKRLVYDIFDFYVDCHVIPAFMLRILKSIDIKMINKADAVIICSERRKEQIAGSNPRKLYIIENSPSAMQLRKADLTSASARIKIVYVGILSEDRYLRNLGKVVGANPQYELHIAGYGLLEKYFTDLAECCDNIIYYGCVDYKFALQLENSCDIMLALYDPSVPNHYYAAPNKYYEAMMLGKPLIVIKNTGIDRDVIEHGVGEVIDLTRDFDFDSGFINALSRLTGRQEQWKEISCRMKKIYEESLSWDIMESRLLNLYRDLQK